MNNKQTPELNKVKLLVRELLGSDTSGHADDHVERVALLAERFASECSEPVDLQEVLLTAWLHDVDDYKLVGKAQAEKLTNAVNIMAQAEVSDGLSRAVLENIAAIGYSKRLNGKQPQRLAGQIVSDADMCDAIGAVGIERRWFMLAITTGGFLIPKFGQMLIWRRTNITLTAIRMIPTASSITFLKSC